MLGCGRVLKGIAEDYPTKQEKVVLNVNPSRIIKNIGAPITLDEFVKILEDLEFKCNLKSAEEISSLKKSAYR